MDNTDNHIDWDKLIEIMDRGSAHPELLSEAERDMLESALELRLRLNMDRFPMEQGWEDFLAAKQKIEHKTKRRKLNLLRWAAAASLLVLAAIGSWWLNGKNHSANKMAAVSDQIILKRNGGKSVVLGQRNQSILDSTVHIQSDANGIVYTSLAKTDQAAITFDTLEVPRGKTYALQLPDGSKVTLNAASRLIFPEVFKGNKREVYVMGEAFFDIKHNSGKAFVVHTGQIDMTVLGTSFDVNTYDRELKTTLVSGKLMVSSKTDRVLLMPGEQSVCDVHGGISKQKVDARLYTAWYHGDLFFDNETLEDITNTLGRVYDYDFEFMDQSLQNVRLTLDMPKPISIEEVFKQIQLTGTKLSVSVQGRQVVLQKGK